jgi:ankyrin repeat protein
LARMCVCRSAVGAEIELARAATNAIVVLSATASRRALRHRLLAGGSALHAAFLGGTLKGMDLAAALQMLLDAGAQPRAVDEKGSTPLHLAAERGETAAVRALVDAGAAPDVASASGLTALMRAAARGSVAGVRSLIGAGASVDMRALGKGLHGATALYLAAQGGHVDVARALLDAGSSSCNGSRQQGRVG